MKSVDSRNIKKLIIGQLNINSTRNKFNCQVQQILMWRQMTVLY